MRIQLIILILLPLLSVKGWSSSASTFSLTDDQIRQLIMEGSINAFNDAYPNSCACPYSLGKNGRSCGMDSAYYQGTGAIKLRCYPRDVTDEEVVQYRYDYALPDRPPANISPSNRPP